MKVTECIIIGAGVSGLATARLLNARGIENIVLEKSDRPGGLIKCDRVNGHLFHRVGGHVFNTRIAGVANWFWGCFNAEQEFLKAARHAGIFMQEQFLGYPIENYLYRLPEPMVKQIVNELLESFRMGSKPANAYANFEAFLKGNFGQTLYNLYFEPYNHKIWNIELNKVPLEWLDGKLPMPQIQEILHNNIMRHEESSMVHSSFFYPQNGGSQFIADRLAEGSSLFTQHEVRSIERRNGNWVVDDAFHAPRLIYTGDVRQLRKLIKGVDGSVNHLLEQVTHLRSNGTSNLLCETDNTPYSWLYLPEQQLLSHRIIYTGNFSATNQPEDARKSCTVEFSGIRPVEEMIETIKKLPGNLTMIDFNIEPNSYVVQQHGDRERIDGLKSVLGKMGFYLVGRFAEWEYHNMDKAIESAMNTVSSFRLNTEKN
jgi:protoporphyrinogen oxidase